MGSGTLISLSRLLARNPRPLKPSIEELGVIFRSICKAMGSSETRLVQELVLYAASAALSCLVLFAGLRQLDPNRAASKKALEQKKEIAKRLGRPLINTNQYEVV